MVDIVEGSATVAAVDWTEMLFDVVGDDVGERGRRKTK